MLSKKDLKYLIALPKLQKNLSKFIIFNIKELKYSYAGQACFILNF